LNQVSAGAMRIALAGERHTSDNEATAHTVRYTYDSRHKLALMLLLVATAGCEDMRWPFHHPQTAPADAAPADAGTANGNGNAECADLLSQMRQNQQLRRQAPTTSTDPDIVSASQGRADKRIEDSQRRYDELDCPAADADAAIRPGRQAPLQPAPGGPYDR
jgi:hypothetical protein